MTLAAFVCSWAATTTMAVAAPTTEELQQQIDELKTQLAELEEQLQATEEAQEEIKTKALQGEKMKVSGYIIARYVDKEDADSDFNVSRARLKLKGNVTEKTGFTLQIDARSKDGKVDLRDAYIDQKLGDGTWRLRGGQAKIPIMLEVLESSSVRLSPERTAVARASFPGERDVGIQLHGAPKSWNGASLDVGIVNGQGRNKSDANNHKDWFARVLVPLGTGKGYAGYYDGEFTSNGTTTDKQRFALGAEWPLGSASQLRAEYVDGENLGFDTKGWYGQLAYTPVGGPNTFFVRYDKYDEDTSTSDTDFQRTTVGVEHKLDKKTRLNIAYESRDADAGFLNIASDSQAGDDNVLTVQLQVKY
jgi:chaperonin cofactor prefoldin